MSSKQVIQHLETIVNKILILGDGCYGAIYISAKLGNTL